MKHALTALLLLPSIALAELPVISDARIVQPPPGTPVAGGFFTVTNPGDEDLVLTSVSSEDIAKVELHLSAVIDDVATMKEQDEIVIPAGTTLEFKHGSYHVMFMGLESNLDPGDEVSITIESSAGPIPIILPVVAPGEAHGEGHGEAHGQAHGEGHSEGHGHGDNSHGDSN
jgi:copper(I)-binding protein